MDAGTANIGILYSAAKPAPITGGYAGAMNRSHLWLAAAAVPLLVLAACGGADTKPPAAPPAKADAVIHETDLLRLTLTPDAQRRLGIRTEIAGTATVTRTRQTSGEIIVPPSGAAGIPVGSASNLAQIGAAQAAADGEAARTQALLRLATVARDRADARVKAEAGSVRGRDEAAAAFETARAAAGVAREQRLLLGPAVAAMARQPVLWVRVPVFGSDIAAVARAAAALLRPLADTTAAPTPARPVAAPPSGNAAAGTTDLFYALDNRAGRWRIGQRVAVTPPLGGTTSGLAVPAAAIVRDINGGEWVYRKTQPNVFVRQRIAVARVADGTALLAAGLESGAEIVTDGAAELFGTEFGTPH